MTPSVFKPSLFKFLNDLKEHNNRDWFQANKERYLKDVKEPGLQFIVDFGPHLLKISPHFRCDPRPNGGSLYRIYRDIRFSKDKTPYKTHAGIYFAHEESKDVCLPGFYLHFQPRNCFVGMGLWHPDNASLKLVRQHIVDHPDQWSTAVSDPLLQERFKLTGRTLKTHPRGFDPDHELIDVLRMKDFTAMTPLKQGDVTAPGFIDEVAALCRAGSGLVQFLCQAVGKPF